GCDGRGMGFRRYRRGSDRRRGLGRRIGRGRKPAQEPAVFQQFHAERVCTGSWRCLLPVAHESTHPMGASNLLTPTIRAGWTGMITRCIPRWESKVCGLLPLRPRSSATLCPSGPSAIPGRRGRALQVLLRSFWISSSVLLGRRPIDRHRKCEAITVLAQVTAPPCLDDFSRRRLPLFRPAGSVLHPFGELFVSRRRCRPVAYGAEAPAPAGLPARPPASFERKGRTQWIAPPFDRPCWRCWSITAANLSCASTRR